MITLVTELLALSNLVAARDETLVLAGNLLEHNFDEVESVLKRVLDKSGRLWEDTYVLTDLEREALSLEEHAMLYRMATVINYTAFITLCKQHTLIRSCF